MIKKILTDAFHCMIEVMMISLILIAVLIPNLPATMPEWTAYLYVAAVGVVYSLAGPCIWGIFRGGMRPLQLILGLACCVAGIVVTFAFMPFLAVRLAYALVVILCVYLRGFYIADKPWDEIAPATVYTFLIFCNMLFMIAVGVLPALAKYRTAVTVFGPVVAIGSLLTMNSVNMKSLTAVQRDKQKSGNMTVSRSMKLVNRLMVLVTFCVVLVLSLFGKMAGLLMKGFKILWAWIVGRAPAETHGPTTSEELESAEDQLMDAVRESAAARKGIPEWLQNVFQVAMYVMAVLLLIALLCLLGYAVYLGVKKLVELYRRMSIASGRKDEDTEEYTDVQERLQISDVAKAYLDKLRAEVERLRPEPSWSSFKTVPEKIRYLYRRAVYKGMNSGWKYSSALTPSQTVTALAKTGRQDPMALHMLGEYYDRVRYGGKEPSLDEADSLHSKM